MSGSEPATTQTVWDERRLTQPHVQPDKADRVRRMFDAIAPTYELINTVFSGGRDRAWRRRLVRAADPRPGDAVLDIACGTGDVLRTFARQAPQVGQFVGADFAHEMLRRAAMRSGTSARDRPAPGGRLHWCEADGLCLPFRDAAFDVTSCAFGVRNFQNLDRGLAEMHRVLRPGGRAVILEFTRPPNALVRAVHEFYSGRFMPLAAALVARDRSGAYRYLPRSVVSFLDAEQLCARLTAAGFQDVIAAPLTFGVVTIYRGTKGKG